jgi:prepilin peptidase CpaA
MRATMTFALHLVPLAGFAGLMAMAALEDFRRLIIPNVVPAGLCALWPLHLLTAPGQGLAAGAAAAGCAMVIFLAGAVLFFRGVLGGGDIKLLAAATLWAGPAGTPTLLVLTGLLGGLLSVFVLTPLGRITTAASGQAVLDRTGGGAADDKRPVVVPYGVAIAAAALIVTIPPIFS